MSNLAAPSDWQAEYTRHFAEAMSGCDAVFDITRYGPAHFDAEQEVPIMAAISLALKVPGHTPESVGTAVLRAVARVANDYASAKADEYMRTHATVNWWEPTTDERQRMQEEA